MGNRHDLWELFTALDEAKDARSATFGAGLFVACLWLVWGIDEPAVTLGFVVVMTVLALAVALSWLGASLKVRRLSDTSAPDGEDAP